jgi:predicted metal-binding protein
MATEEIPGTRALDSASLFVCDTCRYDPDAREHEGRTGGVIFAEHIERLMARLDIRGVSLSRMSCLMACTRHCTVHLRSPGKLGYVIGGFAPTEESAQAVFDYVAHYRESPTGQVPYNLWPQGIKGHFIARTPP